MSFKLISIKDWNPSKKVKICNLTGKPQTIFIEFKDFPNSNLQAKVNCGNHMVCLCNLKMIAERPNKMDILLAIPPNCKIMPVLRKGIIGPLQIVMTLA